MARATGKPLLEMPRLAAMPAGKRRRLCRNVALWAAYQGGVPARVLVYAFDLSLTQVKHLIALSRPFTEPRR